MITLSLLSLAVVAMALMLVGFALSVENESAEQYFARVTNGASIPDGLKAHRSR